MRQLKLSTYAWRAPLAAALLLTTLLSSVSLGWQQAAATVTVNPASTLSPAERAAASLISADTIRKITTELSAPDMQGRGTAQPGGERAARYIADRFSKLGLKPLGDAGSYLQGIKFKSSLVTPESSIKAGDAVLKQGADFVLAPPYTSDQIDTSGQLVFVGYGVNSPDLKRNDLEGIDVKGKIAIILSGRPQNADEAAWKKAGSAQALARNLIMQGAAGIILANIGSKAQPYKLIASYLSRRRVQLADAPAPAMKLPPVVLMGEEGLEKLFAGTGQTYAQTFAKAQTGEFASRDLNKQANFSVSIKREEGVSSNVAAVLEGSDPKLKEEAVIYTAHYDAYGVDAAGRIYPGAADNALGVAMITSIAEAFAKSKQRPRRSVIFLAVTGEEYGLLGAEYWVKNPTWPLNKLAANLNYDGIGTEIYGPVKKVVGFGAEYSDLGKTLEDVLQATGVQLTPDPMPEEQAFYRSDHYAFVKKGVPALMLLGGPDGDTAVWLARARKWLETDYHQTTDTVQPNWNWEGPKTTATIGLIVGMRVANAEASPNWLPGAPFKRGA
ncbi:MAG TPA: M20/M25/M40 family metallo-hydrolase [Pyrinomonadaceae bacterium]|nr:M20/M25/M40 family metallo-hydrolase [Pyrinomonadaceae bacterium]